MLASAVRSLRACAPNARRALSVRVLNDGKVPTPPKAVKAAKKGEPSKTNAAGSTPKKEKPPRASSAYSLFVKAKYPEIKKAHPEATFIEATAQIRGLWATATPEAKAPFEREAAESKASIAAQRAEQLAKKKANARPPTAYMLFIAKERPVVKAANPKMSMPEIIKLLGSAWKQLPEEEREKYKAESNKLKEEWKAKQAPKA